MPGGPASSTPLGMRRRACWYFSGSAGSRRPLRARLRLVDPGDVVERPSAWPSTRAALCGRTGRALRPRRPAARRRKTNSPRAGSSARTEQEGLRASGPRALGVHRHVLVLEQRELRFVGEGGTSVSNFFDPLDLLLELALPCAPPRAEISFTPSSHLTTAACRGCCTSVAMASRRAGMGEGCARRRSRRSDEARRVPSSSTGLRGGAPRPSGGGIFSRASSGRAGVSELAGAVGVRGSGVYARQGRGGCGTGRGLGHGAHYVRGQPCRGRCRHRDAAAALGFLKAALPSIG